MRHWWLILPLLLGLTLGSSHRAAGQSEVQMTEPRVSYTFGDTLAIEAKVTSEVPIQTVVIYLQPEDATHQITGEVSLTPEGELTYILDLYQNPLTIFSRVDYWFQINLENGETFKTPTFQFFYEDNRFTWQSLETEEFAIYWYQGDAEFGGTILNTAYESLARIKLEIEIANPQKISYYVYASAQEMQSALQFNSPTAHLVAGHASPAANKVLVSISPGPAQTLEIKRQIPHELMHVLLYQKLGEEYTNCLAG